VGLLVEFLLDFGVFSLRPKRVLVSKEFNRGDGNKGAHWTPAGCSPVLLTAFGATIVVTNEVNEVEWKLP
jgi:hypothetical protein